MEQWRTAPDSIANPDMIEDADGIMRVCRSLLWFAQSQKKHSDEGCCDLQRNHHAIAGR